LRSQTIVFLSIAGVAGGAVLWLDRGMAPFHDEWWFICGRSLWDAGSLLAPHNEHPVLLHAVVYLTIAAVFGASSSLPFLVVLLVLHAAVAAAVLRLTGSMVATAVMLFLGAGYENLFWGFQIGFVGALALGLWAMAAFLDERPWLGASLLVAAVLTQGDGLFVIPAIAAYLLSAKPVRALAYLMPALAVYGFWVLLEGGSIDARGDPPTTAGIVAFTATGIVAAAGFGAGPPVAVGLTALWVAARPRVSPLVIAGATGLVATFVGLGIVRQGFTSPDASRYLYVAAPFVLLVFGSQVAKPLAQRAALSIALSIGVALLVANGLAWPGYVAASRAAGADHPPSTVCRSVGLAR
jgi:hypothetical protein